MELNKGTVAVIVGVLAVLNTEFALAQIGLDWNKLRGEDTGGTNDTADANEIQGVILDILKQLQGFEPDSGQTLSDLLPDIFPGGGEEDGNVTIIPVTEIVDGDGSPFPPGLEGLNFVDPTCWNHSMTLMQDYFDGKKYASQMIAASGSVVPDPSVEYTGLLLSLGLFDVCRSVKETNEGTPFDAVYCAMNLYAPIIPGYTVGQCLPASCREEDLSVIFYTFKAVLPPLANVTAFFSCDAPIPFSGGDIFIIFLCAVLAAFMFAGTLYHLIVIHVDARKKRGGKTYEKPPEEEEANEERAVEAEEGKVEDDAAAADAEGKDAERVEMNIEEDAKPSDVKKSKSSKTAGCCNKFKEVLMCFSILHNLSKIFNTSKQKSTLDALNGLRVLSMFWIIIGHTWQFVSTYKASNPLVGYTTILNKFWFQTILSAVFAVDTFFLLSGLLLTYLTLKVLKKAEGKLNWKLFFFHRWFRITPLYMFVLGIWATLPVHIGAGPGKTVFFNGSRQQCRDLWWTNLFYVNNLVPFPGDLGAQCMGWSWYLANDMQFFILSPLILNLLYRKRKIGIAVISGLIVASFVITIALATYYGLTVGINQIPFNDRLATDPTADVLYGKPYHRIPPYLFGMAIGYWLYKVEGKKFSIPWIANGACWIAAAGMAVGLTYGLYNTAKGVQLTQGVTVFYFAMNPIAWSLAIGWVAIACIKGYGGPVNTILSWPVWIPLARITFGAYLVHPLVQFMYTLCLNEPIPITMSTMTFHAIAFIFVSYATALLFSLALEAPLMGIEKLMFKRK